MTTKPFQLQRLLSIGETADQLGVSSKTIRRLIQRSELHVHRVGRQLRVSEEDLIAFLKARRK